MTQLDPTYTIAEARALLRIGHQTIYNELNAGRLGSYTVGRRRYITGDSILAYIRAREAESVAPSPTSETNS